MKRKFLSFFAIVLMIEMTMLVYAEEFMWNQDTVLGTYTTAEAYVSGYWYYPPGELLDTYAQVKGTVNNALPDDGIVVMYRFQYNDYDSGNQYYFNGAIDEPGEWVKIYTCPGTLTYLISSGRVGYGHEVDGLIYGFWDTREVSACIPFT